MAAPPAPRELSDRRQQLGQELAPSPRERGLKRVVFGDGWVFGCSRT